MIDLESIEEILSLTNCVTLQAKGTSMFPDIVSGDELSIVACKDTNELCDQDILFVNCSGKYLIHRFHKAENKTKGDNCTSFDPPVDKFIGKVTSVKKTPRSILKRISFQIQKLLTA